MIFNILSILFILYLNSGIALCLSVIYYLFKDIKDSKEIKIERGRR